MPSVSQLYGQRPISDAQRRRLFAIALGNRSRKEPGALAGNKRQQLMQLNEMLESFGYDWDAVDEMCNPQGWLTVSDYDEIVSQLLAIKGGVL